MLPKSLFTCEIDCVGAQGKDLVTPSAAPSAKIRRRSVYQKRGSPEVTQPFCLIRPHSWPWPAPTAVSGLLIINSSRVEPIATLPYHQ